MLELQDWSFLGVGGFLWRSNRDSMPLLDGRGKGQSSACMASTESTEDGYGVEKATQLSTKMKTKIT